MNQQLPIYIRDRRRHHSMIVDRAILYEYGLSPQAGWLYLIISDHAADDTRIAFPGEDSLCQLSGLKSRNTLSKYLAELVDAGLLIIHNQFKTTEGRYYQNVYELPPLPKSYAEGTAPLYDPRSEIDHGPRSEFDHGSSANRDQKLIKNVPDLFGIPNGIPSVTLIQPTGKATQQPLPPVGNEDPIDDHQAVHDNPPAVDKPKRDRPTTAKGDRVPKPVMIAMKNAIALAFGLNANAITDSRWGRIEKAAHQLCRAGATPDDIPGLVAYVDKRSRAEKWSGYTEMSLATTWPDYEKSQRARQAQAVAQAQPHHEARPASPLYDMLP